MIEKTKSIIRRVNISCFTTCSLCKTPKSAYESPVCSECYVMRMSSMNHKNVDETGKTFSVFDNGGDKNRWYNMRRIYAVEGGGYFRESFATTP